MVFIGGGRRPGSGAPSCLSGGGAPGAVADSDRVDHPILHRECVWKVVDGVNGLSSEDDLDDVEPDAGPWVSGIAQVTKGCPTKPLTLPAVDGGCGAEPLAFGTCLHLDEDQAVLILCNEIQLTAVGPVIGGKDPVSRRAEMFGGSALAQGSAAEVGRTLDCGEAGPQPVQDPVPAPLDHRLNKSGSGCLRGAKLRRWMGQGPRRRMAARCSAVGYPLCCAKPYPG